MKPDRVLVTHPQHRLTQYFGARAIAQLESLAQVQYNPHSYELSKQELQDLATQCRVVIAYRQTAFDAAVLAKMPSVQAVVRCAVDIRTIDVSAASACGILVTRAGPSFQASVAEWIIGVMIELSRGISAANMLYKAGKAAAPSMGRELRASTVGIVGYGEIGRYVAPLLQAFGCRVVAHDPFRSPLEGGVEATSLEELLRLSDYVLCLAPANADTENMFNARRFEQMKQSAYFINAARGNLVEDAALLHALESSQIAGAAIDVGRAADQMPSAALAQHARIIATPHIGGLTPQAIEQQALECVAQTAQILQGKIPPGAVNPERALRLRSARSA